MPGNQTHKQFQVVLRRFFRLVWVELAVGALIIASVVMTLLELIYVTQADHTNADRIVWIGNLLTYVFVVELTLRFIAASSKKQFLAEYWLDILATIPIFRPFRSLRAFRLLRLFRVLRLIGVINRLASHFPYVFRRGVVEYLVILGLIVITVVFGTIAMVYVEKRTPDRLPQNDLVSVTDPRPNGIVSDPNSDETVSTVGDSDEEHFFSFEGSFWFSIFSLFAGEPSPEIPETWEGKTVAVIIMFMGVTIFAMFTGTVSAFMVERFRMEHSVMEIEDLDGHTIICGWNHKSEIIIRELIAVKNHKAKVVVITEIDIDLAMIPDDIRKCTLFLHDDFTRPLALERANVSTCKSCVILSDITGGRNEQDADARTILAALTVEKINPSVYTCAELMNKSYGSHLEMGNVNDYVVNGEYSAYMMSQAIINEGLVRVFDELLTFQKGQELQRAVIPPTWVGELFDQKLFEVKKEFGATMVAVQPLGGGIMLNPEEYTFQLGDEIIVIFRGNLVLH